jgi:hypothetical protein
MLSVYLNIWGGEEDRDLGQLFMYAFVFQDLNFSSIISQYYFRYKATIAYEHYALYSTKVK